MTVRTRWKLWKAEPDVINRCPLRHVEYVWVGDGVAEEERRAPSVSVCDAELHLVWTFDIPIDGENCAPIPSHDVPSWSCTDGWEVVCENGHTLARSSAEENADPFVWEVQFGDPKGNG